MAGILAQPELHFSWGWCIAGQATPKYGCLGMYPQGRPTPRDPTRPWARADARRATAALDGGRAHKEPCSHWGRWLLARDYRAEKALHKEKGLLLA